MLTFSKPAPVLASPLFVGSSGKKVKVNFALEHDMKVQRGE
jgi:hypothetical protein